MNITDAIQNRNLMSFIYDGFSRTLEPHTYGIDSRGHMAMRAYQVSGGSKSGEYAGWKIFHICEISNVRIQSETYAGPRRDYKRDDKTFLSIKAQL